MKRTFIIATLILCILSSTRAQIINEILSKDIQQAIPLFERISDFRNLDGIKLLGLGDVAEFAKETKKLNTAFCAYLIENKKFRNILLPTSDWFLRPLNSYLNSRLPTDSVKIDSLAKNIFFADHMFRNKDFRSFILWVKKYNSVHPEDMVNFYGVSPNITIPPAYFLARYIFPIDQFYGKNLSEKWGNENPPDSIAYADVVDWINLQKAKKKSRVTSDLIASCEEDLRQNSAVAKLDFRNPKLSFKAITDKNNYIVGQILKKTDRKTIFFTLNTQVVTTQLRSSFVIEDRPYNSIGKLLKDSLEGGYYVFITDFAGSAKLPVVNYSTRSLDVEITVGQAQAKQLIKKSDYFNLEKDADLLLDYQPISLSKGKTIITNMVLQKDKSAIDAMFLLSDLSEIDLDN